MDDAQLQMIRQVAEPVLSEAAAELVELSWFRQGRQVVIRLLVDKVGGVTIQDCARLNQRVGEALETADYLAEPYTLEVSSPGLDRPLRTQRDFERALGEPIDVELTVSLRGTSRLRGTLLAVQPEAVVLMTEAGNVTIPLMQVRSAVKTIEL
ncbi:MAG: ribosome maturation factor RimP [Candidatus Omnitrophica bacterium]|nr:ribosome maturation factor RimP [Candidatus Omnitrophota bacterium]